MKVGDLVKWTLAWVVMRRDEALWDNVNYRNQVGILEREWELALDMAKNNSNYKIYPEPGTILRCMKWIDSAKGEYKGKLRI